MQGELILGLLALALLYRLLVLLFWCAAFALIQPPRLAVWGWRRSFRPGGLGRLSFQGIWCGSQERDGLLQPCSAELSEALVSRS